MTYELQRVGTDMLDPTMLGHYPTYDDALLARDQDVLDQLEQAGGHRIELLHLIVGPGLRGARTAHQVACSVGQPTNGPVDVAAELAATAMWLSRIHATD
jgi:hypothetical protein